MSNKCYILCWNKEDDDDRLFKCPNGGWSESEFEAAMFTFNLAASEYFKLCEKNPNIKYGVICFEAKLSEVEIEVTGRGD